MKWTKILAQGAVCGLIITAVKTITYADVEMGGVSVTAVGPILPTDDHEKSAVLHLFGAQTIALPLAIRGHSDQPIDVRARLVQLSFSLAAPIRETNVEVAAGQTLTEDQPFGVSISLPLPEVRDETEFELIYQAKTQATEWLDVGRTKFRLYSKKILEALKPLSENVVLRLKDDGDMLRPLFEQMEISFADYRAPVLQPDIPIMTLIVNNEGHVDRLSHRASTIQVLGRESVVIFNEQVMTLPMVTKVPWQNGHLIQVELEILKNLSSDPRAQKTFMKIINLARLGE